MAVALFDLDGTLTKIDTLIPYCLTSLLHQPRRLLRINFIVNMALKYVIGKIDSHHFKEAIISFSLKGASKEYIDKINNFFISHILPLIIRTEIFRIMKQHKKRGDKIYIVSASPDIYLTAIRDEWKIDGLICTNSEWLNGHLTGKILGLNCKGKEKLLRILTIFNQRDLIGSHGYGNSKADEPMLSITSFGHLV